MKKIKNLKKKIFGITLAVGILVLSIVGTTMAYFTDTDEITNVFTAGNVKIEIEGNVFSEAGTVQTPVRAYPGMDIGDGVKVNNIGTEDAYVGIIITLNKAIPEYDANVQGSFDVTKLFAGLSDYDYVVDNTNGETKIFVVSEAALAKEGGSVTFFTNMLIPTGWDHDEMAIFEDLEISIEAYATQTAGFANGARSALNAAFDEWN